MQGDTRTQIDFILTREVSAGRQAKHAPVHAFPLGSWKKGGHLPVQAGFPQLQSVNHDSAALQEAVRLQTPQAQLLDWVKERLDHTQRPQDWDQLLCQATEHFFPKVSVAARNRRCQTPVARVTRGRGPAAEWGQQEHQRTLQEQHWQAVKQARKDKTARFMAEVDQAIAQGDQHVAYQTLKQLRPWKPSLKAQLKDAHGFLLNPESELQAPLSPVRPLTTVSLEPTYA